MTRMQQVVLAALGVALVFTCGCRTKLTGQGPGAGKHYGQQKSRVFPVYIYTSNPGQCLLDWPVATLWKSEQQTVKWFSDDGNQYTIDFGLGSQTAPKNPFQDADPPGSNTFIVPGGGDRPSGALQSGASGYFGFGVHAGDANGPICKKATDPDPGYYVK
jgi:hypothetical protein